MEEDLVELHELWPSMFSLYFKKIWALLKKMENKLVEVHEFSNLGEANIAKGLLESNGIPAFIFQDNRAEGLSMIYRIRLMVTNTDKEEARKLLLSRKK
jgi:hypothetical protein